MPQQLFYAVKVSGRILPERFITPGPAEAKRQSIVNEGAGVIATVVIVNEAGTELIMLDGSVAPSTPTMLFG
jgi:hypothetical protein